MRTVWREGELSLNTGTSTYGRRYYDDEAVQHMVAAGIPHHIVERVIQATEAVYRHSHGCRICGVLFGPGRHPIPLLLEAQRQGDTQLRDTRLVLVCRECDGGIEDGYGIDEMCDQAARGAVNALKLQQERDRARIAERMEKINSKPCAVYVMHAPALAVSKVGISVNPLTRKKSLEKETKTSVTLVNAKVFASRADSCLIEKTSHRELAPHLADMGREWFEVEPRVAIDTVSRIAETLGISPIEELGHNGRRISPITSKCFADVEIAA